MNVLTQTQPNNITTRWPPYASHIVLELAHHKEKVHEHYVRVLYNDEEKIGASSCKLLTS